MSERDYPGIFVEFTDDGDVVPPDVPDEYGWNNGGADPEEYIPDHYFGSQPDLVQLPASLVKESAPQELSDEELDADWNRQYDAIENQGQFSSDQIRDRLGPPPSELRQRERARAEQERARTNHAGAETVRELTRSVETARINAIEDPEERKRVMNLYLAQQRARQERRERSDY